MVSGLSPGPLADLVQPLANPLEHDQNHQPEAAAPGAGRTRLAGAVLVSLVVHLLLLGLSFGGQEWGLPGFGLPWRERRVEVPTVQVILAPARPAVDAAALPEPATAAEDAAEPSQALAV